MGNHGRARGARGPTLQQFPKSRQFVLQCERNMQMKNSKALEGEFYTLLQRTTLGLQTLKYLGEVGQINQKLNLFSRTLVPSLLTSLLNIKGDLLHETL